MRPALLGNGNADVSALELDTVLHLTLVLIPFQLTSQCGLYYLMSLKRSELYTGIQTAKLLFEVALNIDAARAGATIVEVDTAEEMTNAVLTAVRDADVLLMAAAVAASLPDSVREAARSTEWAPEVLFYTLLDSDSETRERQLLIIAQRMGGDSEAQVRGLVGAAGLPGPQQRAIQ